MYSAAATFAGPTFHAQNGPSDKVRGSGRGVYVKAKVRRVGVEVSVAFVTIVRLLRTKWVSPFVLCTSPHPNDTHGRPSPAKLHALGGPLALSVLSECDLTQTDRTEKPSASLAPPFLKEKRFGLIEHGDSHHVPTYIARGGHFDRPAHSREFRLRRGGVPVARDVDRRSAGPRRGGARVVRDAHGERDDAHHFVQVRVAEAL